MIPIVIGVLSGLLAIITFGFFKQSDKLTIYGLTLSGIGFLYVGFTWSDTTALIINGVQAMTFLLIAWYGVKKGPHVLGIGYLLHGTWDLAYNLLPDSSLMPPHYDLFCLSVDFTIGLYLILRQYKNERTSAVKMVA